MNLKILGKAMGFMFLPTLGILLMLLVGFFDPMAMWTWIKSNSGWAITVRILLFIAEVGLVTIMYLVYLTEENEKKALDANNAKGSGQKRSYDTYLRQIFDGSSRDTYQVFDTDDPSIKVIKHTVD